MVYSTPDAAHIDRTTPSSELSQVMAHPESFRLLYFPVEAQGQTSRDLLTYGGANWEGVYPQNWLEEKGKTPFGFVPVLYINKGDKQVVISETHAVENYLAKHFGLMGDNEYEETLIRAFHCSSTTLFINFQTAVVWNMAEVREKALENFKANKLAHWVKTHERHLMDNGNNGHYLGNKMSLADIRTANLIKHLSFQPWATELMDIISQAPALLKLMDTVENDPKMRQWKNSDEAKKLATSTKAFFVNPFAASGRPTA
ncbi:hypothetical protein EC957_001172 [Mortierella hygrophila]|uniref:Glutathione S-transferase n=1 Tax=Mortierella hygrophila TaxID=979708 RepID=A0A9P6K7P2_9FUNG|nr:hypothetical protein EC957_001172 [Mortierella hygrophila]